jgi:hypothetical protein
MAEDEVECLMSHRNPRRGGPDNTNPLIPDSPPTLGPADWQMKSLNDLTVAVGQVQMTLDHLAEKVRDLKDDNKALGDRVQKVENKLLVASTVLAVLLAVASVVGSVAAYVGNKAIDFGMDMAKERLKAEATVAQPPQMQPPAKRQ